MEWTTANGGLAWSPADLRTTAGNAAYAYAITDNLRVAGKAKFTLGGQFHALVTVKNAGGINKDADDKGTLPGGTSSEAWDVRDESGSVGWSYNSAGHKRAFFLNTDASQLIGDDELPHLPGVTISTYNSAALGVNRYGQVVGWAQANSGASRAFIYSPGLSGPTMIDLNALLPGGSLWVLTSARSINDAGIIVGTGTLNRQSPRGWILYPNCQD